MMITSCIGKTFHTILCHTFRYYLITGVMGRYLSPHFLTNQQSNPLALYANNIDRQAII